MAAMAVSRHLPAPAAVVTRRLEAWATVTLVVVARAVTVLVLLLVAWVVGNWGLSWTNS